MNKQALLLIVFGFVCFASSAQEKSLETISHQFNSAREAGMQEKLYLHSDRSFYLTGESMYFKIYQVDASFHRPINISKVAYVEVLDQNNTPVVQGKITLHENGGRGSLFLPATLGSGSYLVRAYTKWMRNLDPEYFFYKNITIVNPFVRSESVAARKPGVSVEFFPEGGQLVAQTKCKVAFKLNNVDQNEKYTGYILSGLDTITTFQPLRFNLGHFYLEAEQEKRYRCIIVGSGGTSSVHQLPEIHRYGYTMHVADGENQNLLVSVQHRGNTPEGFVYLFVHSRQVTIHAEAKTIYAGSTQFQIDKNKLPPGITHLTVFNEKLKPVSERLYFTRPKETLRLNVGTDQNQYSPRRKVSLEIGSEMKAGEKGCDVSIAVYRIDSLGRESHLDISSYLLLSSDLRGQISEPAFYLTDGPDVSEATDNLMLTHGWRRFRWEDVMGDKKPFGYLPETRTLMISGKVTKSDGVPVHNVLTYLASPSKLISLKGSRSNAKGEVFFESGDWPGRRKLILQAASGNDSTLVFSIEDPFSKVYADRILPPLNLTSRLREQLTTRSLAMQVQDIYFRDKNDKLALVPVEDSTAFYGVPDQVYYLDDYTRFPVLEEVMREYVPGVFVRKRRDGFHFIVINATKKGVLEGDPLILLDGVPVSDLNRFMKFDPLKIKKLELVMRNYIVGPVRAPGIVSFVTYSGDLGGFEMNSGPITIDYDGLQQHREFYSPAYENVKQRSSRMPDQRTLLYWNPNVTISPEGKRTLEFYTSDVPGEYQVVVEGITQQGKAGSGSTKFSVKRETF